MTFGSLKFTNFHLLVVSFVMLTMRVDNVSACNYSQAAWDAFSAAAGETESLPPCDRPYVECDDDLCPAWITITEDVPFSESFVMTADLMARLHDEGKGSATYFYANTGSWKIELGEWVASIPEFIISSRYGGEVVGSIPSVLHTTTQLWLDCDLVQNPPISHFKMFTEAPNLKWLVLNRGGTRTCEIEGTVPDAVVSTDAATRTFIISNCPNVVVNVTSLSPSEEYSLENVPGAFGVLSPSLFETDGTKLISIINTPNISATLPSFTVPEGVDPIPRVQLQGLTFKDVPGQKSNVIPVELLYRTTDLDISQIPYNRLELFNIGNHETSEDCKLNPRFVVRRFRCDSCALAAKQPGLDFQCIPTLRSLNLDGNDFGGDTLTLEPSLNAKDVSLRGAVNLKSIEFRSTSLSSSSTSSTDTIVSRLGVLDLSNAGLTNFALLQNDTADHLLPAFDANEVLLSGNTQLGGIDVLALFTSEKYNQRLHIIDVRNTNAHVTDSSSKCRFECLDTNPSCLPDTLEFTPATVSPGSDRYMWCRGLQHKDSGSGSTHLVSLTRNIDYFDYEECFCIEGSFGNGTMCIPCLKHMYCPSGPVKVAWAHADEGYYAETKITSAGIPQHFTRCRRDPNGNPLCLRPKLLMSSASGEVQCNQSLRTPTWENECREGHRGRLCAACEDGYGHIGDICLECGKLGVTLSLVGYVLGIVIAFVYAFDWYKTQFTALTFDNIEVTAHVSIVVTTVQVLGVLKLAMEFASTSVTYLFSSASYPSTAEPVDSECLLQEMNIKPTYTNKFWLRIVSVALPTAVAATISIVLHFSRKKDSIRRRGVLLLMNLYYPFIITTCFQIALCSAPYEGSDVQYLIASPAEECFTTSHTRAMWVAAFVLFLMLVGTLAVINALYRWRRDEVKHIFDDSTKTKKIDKLEMSAHLRNANRHPLFFLLRPYAPRRWWWFVVVYVRNVALVLIVSLVPREYLAAAVLFVLSSYVVLLMQIHPFTSPATNALCLTAEVAILLVVAVMSKANERLHDPSVGAEVAVMAFCVVVMVTLVGRIARFFYRARMAKGTSSTRLSTSSSSSSSSSQNRKGSNSTSSSRGTAEMTVEVR
eukprot:PhM_4_TR2442/c0_g1_i1/m.14138